MIAASSSTVFCTNYLRFPVEFSAQNDVRLGLQWEDFLGKCSSKLLHLFGLHWASNGCKMVQEWGGKRQINTPLLHLLGLKRGVKWCKSSGVMEKLPPNSYIVLPLDRPKRCKSAGLICLLPPHSYTNLPPLEAQCSPQKCKSFELKFP